MVNAHLPKLDTAIRNLCLRSFINVIVLYSHAIPVVPCCALVQQDIDGEFAQAVRYMKSGLLYTSSFLVASSSKHRNTYFNLLATDFSSNFSTPCI